MRTDVGAVRDHNEDAVYVDPGRRFFIVADGMGGRSAGEVASAMAVSIVRAILEASESELAAFAAAPSRAGRQQISLLLERAARAANASVFHRSVNESDKHGMGTTLEVVVITGGEAFIAHVGDSRTYVVRRGVAHQVTVDHTVAQVMVDRGTITPEEAEESPMRSVLSNAIGGCTDLEVEHVHVLLEPGDRVLVCSDGLHEYLDRGELAAHVTRRRSGAAVRRLVDEACERGGHDNITAILVEVGAPAAAALSRTADRAAQRTRSTRETTPLESPGPLAGADDDALAAIVEEVLRESSRAHRAVVEG